MYYSYYYIYIMFIILRVSKAFAGLMDFMSLRPWHKEVAQ